MLQQSIVTVVPDQLYNTMFDAEKMAEASICKKDPTTAQNFQKADIVKRMAGPAGFVRTLLRQLADMLLPESDLRIASFYVRTFSECPRNDSWRCT